MGFPLVSSHIRVNSYGLEIICLYRKICFHQSIAETEYRELRTVAVLPSAAYKFY